MTMFIKFEENGIIINILDIYLKRRIGSLLICYL